jgi:hypothetical protein
VVKHDYTLSLWRQSGEVMSDTQQRPTHNNGINEGSRLSIFQASLILPADCRGLPGSPSGSRTCGHAGRCPPARRYRSDDRISSRTHPKPRHVKKSIQGNRKGEIEQRVKKILIHTPCHSRVESSESPAWASEGRSGVSGPLHWPKVPLLDDGVSD